MSAVNTAANPPQEEDESIDQIGAAASIVCALHCAIVALAPALLGAIGLGALVSAEAEWLFTIVSIAFALGALWSGWKTHRSKQVAALFIVGSLGLLASRGIEMGSGHHHHDHHGHAHGDHHDGDAHGEHHAEGEPHGEHEEHGEQEDHDEHDEHGGEGEALHLAGSAVGVIAGLLLAAGHVLNIRTCRACKNCA